MYSAAAVTAFAQQIPLRPETLIIDGLPLGGRVRLDSQVYKQYNCSPSSQFLDFTFCKRTKTEIRSGATVTVRTTLLHSSDGIVVYINQEVEPAFFARGDVEAEIARLTSRRGQPPRMYRSNFQQGLPQAVIAIWGPLRIIPLSDAEVAGIREGRSPGKGILVDYLGNFTRSAQLGLPIFSMDGEFGYAWSASFNESGQGSLRFFAIDAATLWAAHIDADHPATTTNTQQQPAPTVSDRDLAVELLKVAISCPAPVYVPHSSTDRIYLDRSEYTGTSQRLVLQVHRRVISQGAQSQPTSQQGDLELSADLGELAEPDIAPGSSPTEPAELTLRCKGDGYCLTGTVGQNGASRGVNNKKFSITVCNGEAADNIKAALSYLR